jgi:hypothetical protein
MLTIDYLNNRDAKIRQNRLSSMEAKLHLDKIKCALDEIGEDSGSEFAGQERAYSVRDALIRVAERR